MSGRGVRLIFEEKGDRTGEEKDNDPAIGLWVEIRYEEGIFEGKIIIVESENKEVILEMLVQW